jgi:plastocyanin
VGIPRTGPRGALNIGIAVLAVSAGINGLPVHADRIQTGTLQVIVRGTAQARPPLRVSIDNQICGDTVPDESVVMTRGLVANAVVTIPGLPGTHPASVEIANDKCRFVPHVALAAPGAAVRMISRDATLHTVHAQHQGKSLFNVGLPIPNVATSRPAQGQGPVLLKCNTHPWMSGVVYLASDRAVITGNEGAATFDSMPAGTHRIAVWHEALGTVTGTATVSAGKTTTVELTLAGK